MELHRKRPRVAYGADCRPRGSDSSIGCRRPPLPRRAWWDAQARALRTAPRPSCLGANRSTHHSRSFLRRKLNIEDFMPMLGRLVAPQLRN
jgi:hypothetical protein